MTEYFIRNHPCLIAGVVVVVSFVLQGISIAAEARVVGLVAGIIFIIGLLLGFVGLYIRSRARRNALGFCEKCGEPYVSEDMRREHAQTHN